MRKLKFEYSSFLWFRKVLELDVPETWSDLNEAQFSVCSDLYQQSVSDIDFVSRFFSISKRVARKLSKFELYRLTELCTFVSEPNGQVNYFYLKQIPGTDLLAPKAKFNDVDFERFALFDTYFFVYVRDQKPSDLCRFIAALYLKKGEVATNIDFEKRVDFIKNNVDDLTRNAIFLNYLFLHKWLEKPFPYLFESREIEETETDTAYKRNRRGARITKPIKANIPDWSGILDAFVGDDILNFDKYKQTNCILMFKRINARIKSHQTK